MDFTKFNKYRSFIRGYLEVRAPRARGEITRLAEFAGIHPTFVSQVLAGTKEFSMEQGFSVAEYLELTESERTYFLLLLQRDRAGTKKLKDYFNSQLNEFRKSLLLVSSQLKEHRQLMDEDRAIFYSSWLYAAIRLYCSVGNGPTLEDICSYFGLRRQKAIKILEFLVSTDLVNYEKGSYRLGSQHTHLPSDSPFIVRHHMNWRTKALQRHDNVSNEEIAFTAPMSIAKEDFQKIREKILECIKDSIEIAKKSDAKELAFLNIDWLWVNEQSQVDEYFFAPQAVAKSWRHRFYEESNL